MTISAENRGDAGACVAATENQNWGHGDCSFLVGRVEGGALFAGCLFDLFETGVGQIGSAHDELVDVVELQVRHVELEVPGRVAVAAAGGRLGDTDLIL